MAKVYTDWRTLPDDPNRVGDYDYDPMPNKYERDEDAEYERMLDELVREGHKDAS